MAALNVIALTCFAGQQIGRRQLLANAALSTSALLPLPARATVAFDMSRYGDRELQVATLNRLKQAVRDLSLIHI